METGIIKRGMNRLGLIGILGAGLAFALSTGNVYGQNTALQHDTLSKDPTLSQKTRDQEAYLAAWTRQVGFDKDVSSKEDTPEEKAEKERKQTPVYEKKAETDFERVMRESKEMTDRIDNEHPEWVLERLHKEQSARDMAELQSGRFPQYSDAFFACNEWIDGYNGGKRDGTLEPREFVGLGKKVFKRGEKITIITSTNKKEGASLNYEIFRDNEEKPLFKVDFLIPPNYTTRILFDEINPKPGKYTTIFKQGNFQVGLVEFTVE